MLNFSGWKAALRPGWLDASLDRQARLHGPSTKYLASGAPCGTKMLMNMVSRMETPTDEYQAAVKPVYSPCSTPVMGNWALFGKAAFTSTTMTPVLSTCARKILIVTADCWPDTVSWRSKLARIFSTTLSTKLMTTTETAAPMSSDWEAMKLVATSVQRSPCWSLAICPPVTMPLALTRSTSSARHVHATASSSQYKLPVSSGYSQRSSDARGTQLLVQ
mmetsp:Transcript_7926/g.28182  ORF Transcript_7926/g.28182 Transcript_7926/m.28182 type:complete len:219 (+) Transcript_7926:1289-1945(+)